MLQARVGCAERPLLAARKRSKTALLVAVPEHTPPAGAVTGVLRGALGRKQVGSYEQSLSVFLPPLVQERVHIGQTTQPQN